MDSGRVSSRTKQSHATNLFRTDYPEFVRLVHEVLRVVLRWDPLHCRWLHEIIPSLFLSKMNGVLFTLERYPRSLHVIRRARPSHQRILPPSRSWQDIPIDPPSFALRSTTLHGVPRRLINTDGAVTQLDWSTADSVCYYNLSLRRGHDLC